MMKNNCFISLLFILSCLSCSQRVSHLEEALAIAGENRIELQKVLDHYRNRPEDSLKYCAAVFLVENMIFHYATERYFANSKQERIPFDATTFPTMEAVSWAIDSLKRDYTLVQDVVLDIQTLNATSLILHIDRMMVRWQNARWHKHVNFDLFCQYILPYRVQNEPVSEWFETMSERYIPLLDSVCSETAVEACKVINKAIGGHLQYDNRWVSGLGVRSVSQLLSSASGMCDDLANYGVCVMRVAGIPTAIDFTQWVDMNMGHSWCVVFDGEGKAHSFGAGEQSPGEHITVFGKKKMAKVYRKHFDLQKESLAYINGGKEELPSFFKNCLISDVTHEYVQTVDIDCPVFSPITDKYVYLCIFNIDWHPYAWGQMEKEKAHFRSMGKNAVYLPVVYRNKNIVPVGHPVILQEDGSLQPIDAEVKQGKKIEIVLSGWFAGIGDLENKEKYTLYYWNNKQWISHCEATGENDKLVFRDVPAGCLYKLQHPSRCFIVENKSIKWY